MSWRTRRVLVGVALGSSLVLAATVIGAVQGSGSGTSSPSISLVAAVTSNGVRAGGSVSPSTISGSATGTLKAVVTADAAMTSVVDIEVYSPSGAQVFQKYWLAQSLPAHQTRTFSTTWQPPAGSSTYRVKIGVFTDNWQRLLAWADRADAVTVTGATGAGTASGGDSTPPPATLEPSAPPVKSSPPASKAPSPPVSAPTPTVPTVVPQVPTVSQVTRPLTIPPTLGTHDPSRIINDNGSYYFYSTSGGLSGWYTTDGKNWKQTPAVFKNGFPAEMLKLVPTNNGVWAPDVIYSPTQKLFLMYYSIANWYDATKSAIGLVTSPTLNPNASNYHWTDRGVVISRTSAATGSTIDPAPFFDANGNLWLSYGSGYSGVNRAHGINVIALDKNTGLRSDNNIYTTLSCGCEGSYVQYHSGYYYQFWNTGGCCSGAASTYTIHVARSTSPQGPYTGGRTFFASTGSIHGPGHIGILSENGKDYYSYHYYPNSGGSVLGFGTITWGSDGWPQH